jgi:hypothetical protein
MKKFATTTAIIIVLAVSLLISLAAADNIVAVQTGDWMEYSVTTTGNPTPIHHITWARLDVKTVTGPEISTDIQTQLANGTLWLEPDTTFNVATGVVGEGAIIPTNLTVGDIYYSEYEGNITVTGTRTLTVAGAERVVLTGEAANTSFMWDKETGVMVKATTTLPDCTVYSEIASTNLWHPQTPTINIVYAFIAAAITALVAVVLAGVFLRYQHRIRRRPEIAL